MEHQYEAARREALERLKEKADRRRQEEKRQAETLRQQMEELKLREMEVRLWLLGKEPAPLLLGHWEPWVQASLLCPCLCL